QIFGQIQWGNANRWREIVSQIEVPLLIMHSDGEGGSLMTPAVAQEAVSLAKNAQSVQISGTGHHIHRQDYSSFFKRLRTFLQAIDE
ncbi:MAG: alpha/beta hydrolase, partial [Chloroflexota bacterium]